ncbi:MAG: hypothetical protein ACPHID_01100 [Thermoplasmatota archaeon]
MSNVMPLTADAVREFVNNRSVGFYRLGRVIDGQFYIDYFGRSDTNLQRRLLEHVKSGAYSTFEFLETNSIGDAYHMECSEWHLNGQRTMNKIHPALAEGLPYACPWCDLAAQMERQAEVFA